MTEPSTIGPYMRAPLHLKGHTPMEQPQSKGPLTRAADGTYDLSTPEPRAVVTVKFRGKAPGGGNSTYERTERLRAANQPSSVLVPMLEAMGVHVEEILDVTLVCEACHYPADGLVHTGC
ncbi:hypothetical protein CPI83_30120 (plasmid) [Rhodococcus sp. H-CA8f]|nr:hypothetical protein CPI83_30120 [Rhodococcus sp. H-CA8f]